MSHKNKMITIILATFLAVTLVGCGTTTTPSQPMQSTTISSEPPPSSRSETPEISSVPVSTPAPDSTSEAEEDEIKPISFNDTIVTENWEVSIQSTEFEDISADGEEKGLLFAWMTVKNLQKEWAKAFDYYGDSILVEADYNGGYTYIGAATEGKSLDSDDIYLDPLETNSNITYVFILPKEVAENIDESLVLIITVEGVKYQLAIR